MPTPDFVLALRRHVGHSPLWLSAAIGVVVRHRGGRPEVLLVRRSDDGEWTPTAGIVDPGEEPHQTAVREVLEETGVTCAVERLTWLYAGAPITHVNGDHSQYLEITFRCRWISGEPYPADSESTEAGWFALDALPAMRPEQEARVRSAFADGPPWLGRQEGLAAAGLS